MNIALVDDLSSELSRLSDIINEYLTQKHITAKISAFQSAESFLEDFRPFKYTLIFMDIYMDNMNGIDAAKKIRETDKDTFIVFLTTSPDHAFDAFGVHAYQYILKSPDTEAIRTSMHAVLSEVCAFVESTEGKLNFLSDGIEHSISFSDIIYAQSQKNYIQITDRFGESYRTRMTFSDLSSILVTDNRFLQINRGIIVNMDCITSFDNKTCTLTGDYSLPINVREQKTLDLIRKNYVFSKLHNRHGSGGNQK